MLPAFIKGKRCPKCGGNIYLDRDYYPDGDLAGWYEYQHCLQCGHIQYLDSLVQVAEEIVASSSAPAKKIIQYV
jgi:hypothetical protein